MNVDGRHILEKVRSDFMRYVDAKVIAPEVRRRKIISEIVETRITNSESSDGAKQVLFEHLRDQATLEGLRDFCSVMKESEGYQLMQKFGEELQARLEEVIPRPGSGKVSFAAASGVEMEGNTEQQHTLSRAWRKRPPEDHAVRERKRLKYSDSAGQQSSPIDEIGREVKRCIALNVKLLKTKDIEPEEVVKLLYSRICQCIAETLDDQQLGNIKDRIAVDCKRKCGPFKNVPKALLDEIEHSQSAIRIMEQLGILDRWLNTTLLDYFISLSMLDPSQRSIVDYWLQQYREVLSGFCREFLVKNLPDKYRDQLHTQKTHQEHHQILCVVFEHEFTKFTLADLQKEIDFLKEILKIPPGVMEYLQTRPSNSVAVYWLFDMSYAAHIFDIHKFFWPLLEHRILSLELKDVATISLRGSHVSYLIKNALRTDQNLIQQTEVFTRQFRALVALGVTDQPLENADIVRRRTVYKKFVLSFTEKRGKPAVARLLEKKIHIDARQEDRGDKMVGHPKTEWQVASSIHHHSFAEPVDVPPAPAMTVKQELLLLPDPLSSGKVMSIPGSSQVSSAAASDVEVEGGIEQQRALGKAQRKRPPEDHTGHEWKRQKDSDSAGPMSDYNYSALIAFQERLKTNVAMKPHLIDMLEEQAGGFMTRSEAQSVRNAKSSMGRLIEILLGKGDKEFKTFCYMLEKSNHRGWADRLRLEARPNRQKEDRTAVVASVHPAYDVEEADRFFLEKAIMTVAKNKKLDPLKLKKDLYRHTYVSVERILEDNAQHFRHMVRAAELAAEDEEVAKAVTTTRTVAELLDKLRIETKWEDTNLLTVIVLSLPEEPRTLAKSLLKRYDGYLEVYDNVVPAQDSLQMQLAVPDVTKPQIPVKVTVSKCLAEFMNKDCNDIVNLLLHNSYKIPLSKIMATDIETGGTTVVFRIDKTFTENIIHSSRRGSSLWAFQELCVTRVRFSDFELNVVQLLTQHFKEALRSGLTGGMDFVSATKALPYQVYALIDPDIAEELVIRTIYRKIAHPCPEQGELVSGTADSEGVETTPEMYEDNFPEGKMKEGTDSGELLSRVQELENELKDSEWKRMDLTHENMALVNHLNVCQEQKDHTEQAMVDLKKRLVYTLSSQGGAVKDSALTAPSDSHSKRIPHRWWLKVSAGSYDTSLLQSSPMKQAEGSREMGGEVVFRRDTKSNLLKAVSGTELTYRRGALERGRRANLCRHRFTHYHRRWLADNVQKEEEDSCKLWLLHWSPDVSTVKEGEEHGVDEEKMSEEVAGSGELLSRVQELKNELKDSEQKRMDLIQENTKLQKILKACREQEDHTRQEMADLKELLSMLSSQSVSTSDPVVGALREAAVEGNQSIVRLLVKQFVNVEDQDGRTPLLLAVEGGHTDLVRLLTEQYEGDIFHKMKNSRNALHLAADRGHLPVFQYLCSMFGDRVLDRDSNDESCLNIAQRLGQSTIVEFFTQNYLQLEDKTLAQLEDNVPPEVEEEAEPDDKGKMKQGSDSGTDQTCEETNSQEGAQASQILERHEEEFFEVVDAKVDLFWLLRKKVITESLKVQIESSDNKNAKEVLFHHLHRNADVAALREYCKMAAAADGFPNMQQLGEKMLSELPPEALADTGPTPLQGESLAAPSTNAPGPSREGGIPSEQPGHAAPHFASLSQRDMYWPEFRTLQHEFATIVSKLSKVLSALTPAEFESLLVYLREQLKPTLNGCLPTGQPADLPKGTVTPSTLLQHLQNRWDYLNTDLIEDIIQHICEGILQHVSITASSLQSLMTKYKDNVCSKVTHTLEECKRKKVKLSAPPNYTTMAFEMNPGGSPLSFHLRQILDLKDVLVRRFGVCGALFAGWSEGSIVLYFFIPEEAVYSLCPKLESDCASLQRLHVTTVVVFGHFSVDVGYQQMSLLHKVFQTSQLLVPTLHSVRLPDLPIAMSFTTALVIAKNVYVCGGVCPDATSERVVQVYDLDKETWTKLPPALQYHSEAAAINNQLVLIGGREASSGTITNMVSTWTGQDWQQDITAMPTKRVRPGVTTYNKYLMVAGGMAEDNQTLLGSIDVMDTTTRQWYTLANLQLPRPLYCMKITVSATHICVASAVIALDADKNKVTPSKNVWQLPVSTLSKVLVGEDSGPHQWTEIAQTPHYCSALLQDTAHPLAVGGRDDSGKPTADITVYDRRSNKWSKVGQLQEPRVGCTAVSLSRRSFLVCDGRIESKVDPSDIKTPLSSVEVVSVQ